MTENDIRLIEDYLPIVAISAEASREKSVRKGHISTLHLWWARRPLVACRAAVYGALVPADRWVKDVELKNPPADPEKAERFKNGTKRGLNRRAAAEFVTRLCKYPGDPKVIAQAQRHILEAHAERLTREKEAQARQPVPPVTVEDIEAGRAPRPKVLDMFAGGGAIPLEALRLGCEAYALDLNPVAHLIELCTLVYPQKFGQPDPTVRGMTGPPLLSPPSKGGDTGGVETTWGGLANEVRYWGEWVLNKVKAEIGDLYPLIPDPTFRGKRQLAQDIFGKDERIPPGFLQPVAYLWTRTVRCKNPACKAVVPLVRQTWLCKKKGRFVALKMIAPPLTPPLEGGDGGVRGEQPSPRVRFEVVESATEKGLGFDPTGFSKAGNATCPFCGTVADNAYVKSEGQAGRIDTQPMAVVCTRPGKKGKVYLAAPPHPPLAKGGPGGVGDLLPDDAAIQKRIAELCQRTGLTVPDEPIVTDAKNSCWTHLYGLTTFGHLFTPRQMLCLLTFTAAVREAYQKMVGQVAPAAGRCVAGLSQASTGEPPVPPSQGLAPMDEERAKAVATYLACALDKVAEIGNNLGRWEPVAQCTRTVFGRQALPMVWDYGETVPIATSAGNWKEHLGRVLDGIALTVNSAAAATVSRGSATALPWDPEGGTGGPPVPLFDAVITDPPYYDNISYSNLSDFFYVWLKRTIGHLYPEHFSSPLTPKKQEAVADASRHGKDKAKSRAAYEQMMAQALAEAHRVLKPGGALVVVYAHKTTLGWATLVEALRRAGFTITEAWPLDTEMKSRLRGMDSAALASSIFLVGRKREATPPGPPLARGGEATPPGPPLARGGVGGYETAVQPELEAIVRERVETLWEQGISGADLVIACVGAGLRAFTKYERVEYANGEEVPAERFLAEVEGVVLDAILRRLSKEVGGSTPPGPPFGRGGTGGLAGVDPATRFYVLWRYTYKNAELDAGEAIVFANGTHVELDGPAGLSSGARALVEKKKGKYRLRDYSERGDDDKLGMLDAQAGTPVPLIDALHRTLWLMEHRPRQLGEFLREAQPNREQMRLVAQALAGPALKGSELADVSPSAELSALGKLTANWKSVVEDNVFSAEEQADRKRGQRSMFE